MPRVNPNESFEVAAGHLFRHLHAPRHLKDNPIVQGFFREPGSQRYLHIRDHEGLKIVHDLIRGITADCKQADLSAGEHERAHRHSTIVHSNLLERQSIPDVARDLGISVRQCYRERNEICGRIARRLRDETLRPEPEITLVRDEIEFRMRHAQLKAEIGDVSGALRSYESIVNSSARSGHKIAALCESAIIKAWSGELNEGEAAFTQAQGLFSQDLSARENPTLAAAEACLDLARATLSRSAGLFSEALRILNEARARLEPIESAANDYVKEIYVRVLVACSSNFVWHFGDFHGSVANISKAHIVLKQLATPAHGLDLDVELRLCRRRNDMVLNANVWRPVRERLTALVNAFDRTRSSGSLNLGLYATICLADYHASAGDDAELFDDIRYALALLRQAPSQGYFKSMPYDLAEILLRTRYWEFSRRILDSAEGATSGGAIHPEGLEYVQAYCNLRAGAYRKAWDIARTQRSGDLSPHIVAKMQVVGAASADALGERRQARKLIEIAVNWLEQYGSAPDLREAYSVAAKVLGDPRFRRTADEIGSALGAKPRSATT